VLESPAAARQRDASILDVLSRDDFNVAELRFGLFPLVRFDEADHDVDVAPLEIVRLVDHAIRLADARRRADVQLQLAAFLSFDQFQKITTCRLRPRRLAPLRTRWLWGWHGNVGHLRQLVEVRETNAKRELSATGVEDAEARVIVANLGTHQRMVPRLDVQGCCNAAKLLPCISREAEYP